MKRLINKLSLLLALFLVINSCNNFYLIEVSAEDTSSLSIDEVNFDVSKATDVSEKRILTSKELSVSVNTTSSSQDVQTFTLYRINRENKEYVKNVEITPNFSDENVYIAQTTIIIDAPIDNYSKNEYCVGVKSASHTTEIFKDIKTSVNGYDVKTVEIDTVNPVKNKGTIQEPRTFDCVNKTWITKTNIEAEFIDEHSGIKEIKYILDNGSEQDFSFDNHNPNEKIEFKLSLNDNNHIIEIIVIDNAGNEYKCSNSDFIKKDFDNWGPSIDSVFFESYVPPVTGSTTEPATTSKVKKFKEISNVLYDKICIVKDSFTIKVKATDVAPNDVTPSGMSTTEDAVQLYNEDELIGNMKLNNGYYVYTVIDSISADVLKIKAKDANGYETSKKISEIDKSKKNSYYMEKTKPTVAPNYKNAVKSNGKYWFNNNGGDFIIQVEDEDSGISSITIKDTYAETVTPLSKKTFSKQEKKYEQTIDTSRFENGKHIIEVSVTDNCNNITDKVKYTIYIDHKTPSISYEVKSPKSALIDNKDWYDINDTVEIVAKITKSYSGIGNVEFKINNYDYNYTESMYETNEYCMVNLKIPVKEYLGSSNNELNIVGYVESDSDNNNNSQDIYTCYIDKKAPEINSITITKNDNTLLQSTSNLIYTGIYSNADVKFTVESSDAEGDSGIEYVEFAYYKNDSRIVQKLAETDNKYEYVFPFSVDSNVFNCDFEIVAYDKYGKSSKYSPTIKDDKGNSTDNYFVMQENIVPEIDINLPASDGSERTDTQIWYNKNKNISVKLQDMQSGIRYAKIFVNDVEIKEDGNGKKIIDVETSKNLNKNETSLTYNFTTDYIVGKVGESEDGNYKIKVEISDNAGNIQVNNEKEFNIDKTNPNVKKVFFSKKSADDIISTEDFVTGLQYGFYFNSTFYLKVDIFDEKPSSGLNCIEYKLVSYNDGKKESIDEKRIAIINGIARIDVPKDFKGQILIKAIDMVGNTSKEVTTLGYIEDESVPEIDISPLKDTKYKDNNGNNLYSKNVAVNVSIRDTKSGIRTLEYYVNAENHKIEKKVIRLANEGYKEGDKLENGWIITKMDKNLVVEVKQRFVFESDDNNIVAYFKASDRAGNITKYEKTKKFSIDKTNPIIRVDFTSGVKSNPQYYNGTKKAIMTITVEERNFDEKLIDFVISDSYKSNRITPKFVKEKGKYTYVATIDYPEGDYSVQITGRDIVKHKAQVFTNGQQKWQKSYRADFVVDITKPSISTNFSSFSNNQSKNGNYFNKKKTAIITVREHNFDPELMNLNVWEKAPGQGQNLNGTEKNSYVVYSGKGWENNEDTHSIELQFERDGIYKVEIKPSDLAENNGETDSTVVFEIDTTAPEVLMINGESVDQKNTNSIDVYGEKSEDNSTPTVEYYDANFDCIKYEIVKYIPEYSKGKELSKISPISVKKTIYKKKFKLDDFDKDGIYAVEMTAYDRAGNASKVNKNTYVRMKKTDVLAYIEDSHPGVNGEIGTGWYSIEDEDGPLSKRPDNFEDLNIAVLTKSDSKISITLNSNDGDITDTGVECSTKDEGYGAGVYRYVLSKDYFKDHYQEDTDATFYLTVNDKDSRIELGQIHIDNIAPECKVPSYFHNWGWIQGADEKTIEITDISEKIDINSSCVYIDGKKVDYKYASSENKLEFPIEDGSHSIGISLVDYAGNEYNISEISHLGVGNFRLYLGMGITILFLAGASSMIVFRRKKKVRNLE